MNWIANLGAALLALDALPDEEFDLDQFHTKCSYGSTYCIAGVLASTPHFAALGVYAGEDGEPLLPDVERFGDALELLFGCFDEYPDSAFRYICCMYGHSPWDDELLTARITTHKQLAQGRIRRALIFHSIGS